MTPESLRLSVFSSYWYPDEGGAERQLRQVCHGLLDHGWTISVIAGPASSSVPDYPGITVHRLPPHSGRSPLGVVQAAFSTGRRARADVVLGSLFSAVVVGGLASARIARVPAVVRLGGSNLARFHADPLRRAAGRELLRPCDAIVVNSAHLRSQVTGLRSRRPVPVTVLRNGVTLPRATAPVERSGPPVALYYTNAGPKKNDEDFVQIVRATAQVRFRVVGSVGHLPDLPNLTRIGWSDALGDEFAGADVVINTSVFEGSPNFCLQALAAGRPVLGFDNPGLVDLAQHWPDDVRLVPMHDVGQFSRLLSTQDWRAHRVADPPANMSQTVSLWDEFLRGVIANRGA